MLLNAVLCLSMPGGVCLYTPRGLSLATGPPCKREQPRVHPGDWGGETSGLSAAGRQEGIPRLQSPLDSAATCNVLTTSLKGKIKIIGFLYLHIGKSADVQGSLGGLETFQRVRMKHVHHVFACMSRSSVFYLLHPRHVSLCTSNLE